MSPMLIGMCFLKQEPFIDISVGGQTIAGAEPGIMVVWAVTSHNRVCVEQTFNRF